MTPLPPWIDERIDDGFDKTLTQRHVVETMLEAERPFFSIEQLRARVRPNVTAETVRNRLDELREIDVVAAETYPDTITLYYVDHPGSRWPLSPEGKRALEADTPLDALTLTDFLRLRNPAGIRTLVLAGFQLTLVLFALGLVTAITTVDVSVQSDNGLWVAAGNLFLVSAALLVGERIAREWRARRMSRHRGFNGTSPSK